MANETQPTPTYDTIDGRPPRYVVGRNRAPEGAAWPWQVVDRYTCVIMAEGFETEQQAQAAADDRCWELGNAADGEPEPPLTDAEIRALRLWALRQWIFQLDETTPRPPPFRP